MTKMKDESELFAELNTKFFKKCKTGRGFYSEIFGVVVICVNLPSEIKCSSSLRILTTALKETHILLIFMRE